MKGLQNDPDIQIILQCRQTATPVLKFLDPPKRVKEGKKNAPMEIMNFFTCILIHDSRTTMTQFFHH